jgi:hypothetical protein
MQLCAARHCASPWKLERTFAAAKNDATSRALD